MVPGILEILSRSIYKVSPVAAKSTVKFDRFLNSPFKNNYLNLYPSPGCIPSVDIGILTGGG